MISFPFRHIYQNLPTPLPLISTEDCEAVCNYRMRTQAVKIHTIYTTCLIKIHSSCKIRRIHTSRKSIARSIRMPSSTVQNNSSAKNLKKNIQSQGITKCLNGQKSNYHINNSAVLISDEVSYIPM